LTVSNRQKRKIIFASLETEQFDDVKVEELAGIISNYCGYKHADATLCRTIIKMGQDFTCKNNINILTTLT
jgi:DNA gyrase/topoisomerase IV subunit A